MILVGIRSSSRHGVGDLGQLLTSCSGQCSWRKLSTQTFRNLPVDGASPVRRVGRLWSSLFVSPGLHPELARLNRLGADHMVD